MTANKKIIRLTEVTTGTDIEAGRLANLLALIVKLDTVDVTKLVLAAVGTANALCDEKKPSP